MVICSAEPSASEIIPGLWLGDENSANDINFIKRYNIKKILRILPDNPTLSGPVYLHFPWRDEDVCEQDTSMIKTCINFISDSVESDEGILVHCKRGHHRSAVIVVAFMVERLNMDISKVINYIRSKRICSLRRLTCMVKKYAQFSVDSGVSSGVSGVSPD